MKNASRSQAMLQNKRHAKLTVAQVQYIRTCLAQGQALKDIAKNNGVGYTAIRWIQQGFSWSDLPWESEQQKQLAQQHTRRRNPRGVRIPRKLSSEAVQSILRDLEKGISGASLARTHGVSRQAINLIKVRKTWKEDHFGAVLAREHQPGVQETPHILNQQTFDWRIQPEMSEIINYEAFHSIYNVSQEELDGLLKIVKHYRPDLPLLNCTVEWAVLKHREMEVQDFSQGSQTSPTAKRVRKTKRPLVWESLEETCPTLEEGECIYLRQVQFPISGVVFRDTEADGELWEARVLANGTCFFTRCKTAADAKRCVKKRIERTLKAFEEEMVAPTHYEERGEMENILVYLLATIEAREQIIMVTEYHKVWVAICYNPSDGLVRDYTVRYDSEGFPYFPPAEDFSEQYAASFSVRTRVKNTQIR